MLQNIGGGSFVFMTRRRDPWEHPRGTQGCRRSQKASPPCMGEGRTSLSVLIAITVLDFVHRITTRRTDCSTVEKGMTKVPEAP